MQNYLLSLHLNEEAAIEWTDFPRIVRVLTSHIKAATAGSFASGPTAERQGSIVGRLRS